MAELLGTISSAFAVAEVAIQVGSTVSKLCSLWEQVKDVPDAIRDLITEIEILDPVISDMEREFLDGAAGLSPMLFNDTAAKLSAGYCQAAVRDLRALIAELATNIDDTRRRKRVAAKLKVVLKKETLERMQKRLERAIRLLNSAQLNYLTTLTKLQPAIIISKLQASQAINQQGLLEGQAEVAHCEDSDADEVVEGAALAKKPRKLHSKQLALPSATATSWGRVTTVFASRGPGQRAGIKPVFACRFQLPTWLSATAWDLHLGKSYSGWQINLKPRGIIPNNALAIQYARKGDVQGLRDLFHQGLASPTDYSEDGDSLLEYAAMHDQLDVMYELLDHNAGYEQEDVYWAAQYAMAGLRYNQLLKDSARGLDSLSIFQDLVSRGFFDFLEDCVDNWSDSEGIRLTPIVASAVNNQEMSLKLIKHCSPLHYSLPARERAVLLAFIDREGWKVGLLRHVLHPRGAILANDLRLSLEGGYSIFHLTAFHWGRAMARSWFNSDWEDRQLWLSTMKEMISMVDDLHSRASPLILRGFACTFHFLYPDDKGTALFWFLSGICTWWAYSVQGLPKRVNQALVFWAKALEECRIDLKEYGRRELDFFMLDGEVIVTQWSVEGPLRWETRRSILCPSRRVLASFRYGDRADDWAFELDMVTEEFAGDFWDLVESGEMENLKLNSGTENLMLDIPGSWEEEEETAPASTSW